MPGIDKVEIEIKGEVDINSAEAVASRVRAAMRNEVKHIALVFDAAANITSAEFLAFLSTSSNYMQKNGGRISVRGVNSRNVTLLQISKLQGIME